MDVAEISDWDEAAWSEVLAAARGDTAARTRAGTLWSVYAPLLAPIVDRPFVLGQIGQSLDGRVATANGHSHFINGQTALTHLHRLRALMDAVVIGVGTALADDPQLNVRHTDGTDPARVIIDPTGRLSADAKCLRGDGTRRIVIRGVSGEIPAGVEQIVLPREGDGFHPDAVVGALRGLGMQRILIEGGPTTLSRFIAANAVDRLHIMIAPLIIGSGPAGVQLPPIAHLNAAMRPAMRVFRLAGDILCDCDLRA